VDSQFTKLEAHGSANDCWPNSAATVISGLILSSGFIQIQMSIGMWLQELSRRLFLVAMLTFSAVLGMGQELTTDLRQIPTVGFCELVKNPNRYDKQVVRTTAIYVAYYHGTYIYDPGCKTAAANVDAEFEVISRFKTSSLVERRLQELLSHSEKNGRSGRARVTIVARFNNWNGVGYGHLDYSRFQVVVMLIENAKSVSGRVAWNSKGADSFMEDVEGVRNVLDVDWNFAYLLNDAARLEDLMSDDFVLTDEQKIVLNKTEVIALANRAGRVRTGYAVVDEHKAFINGNTAVVTGRSTSGECKNVTRQYRFTNRYLKRLNWEIISSRVVSVVPVEVPSILPCNEASTSP